MISGAGSSLPTRHQILAALRAATALGGGAEAASAHESLLRLPTEGLFDQNSLERGAALLGEVGLLTEVGSRLVPDDRLSVLLEMEEEQAAQLLLALAVERLDPLWLRLAAGGDGPLAEELVPDDVRQTLAAVIRDHEEREALLLALANKFDPSDMEQRSAHGRTGELVVVASSKECLEELGRPELARDVRHVSLISDQLGYDVVAPNLGGRDMRLEVKASSSPPRGDVRVYLSRNEARVGSGDQHWRLVICAGNGLGELGVLGSCPYTAIRDFLPTNTIRGRWESCQLRVPVEVLEPGLSFLELSS